MFVSFLFSFAFSFSSQLFVRPPQTTILPFCISFSCIFFFRSLFGKKRNFAFLFQSLLRELRSHNMHVLVAQLCLTFCSPIDCNPPGSSVLGTFKARILEWVSIPSPGDLPSPRIKSTSLASPALAGGLLTTSTRHGQKKKEVKYTKPKTTPVPVFKCTVQQFWYRYKVVQPSLLIPEHFNHSKKKPHTH